MSTYRPSAPPAAESRLAALEAAVTALAAEIAALETRLTARVDALRVVGPGPDAPQAWPKPPPLVTVAELAPDVEHAMRQGLLGAPPRYTVPLERRAVPPPPVAR